MHRHRYRRGTDPPARSADAPRPAPRPFSGNTSNPMSAAAPSGSAVTHLHEDRDRRESCRPGWGYDGGQAHGPRSAATRAARAFGDPCRGRCGTPVRTGLGGQCSLGSGQIHAGKAGLRIRFLRPATITSRTAARAGHDRASAPRGFRGHRQPGQRPSPPPESPTRSASAPASIPLRRLAVMGQAAGGRRPRASTAAPEKPVLRKSRAARGSGWRASILAQHVVRPSSSASPSIPSPSANGHIAPTAPQSACPDPSRRLEEVLSTSTSAGLRERHRLRLAQPNAVRHRQPRVQQPRRLQKRRQAIGGNGRPSSDAAPRFQKMLCARAGHRPPPPHPPRAAAVGRRTIAGRAGRTGVIVRLVIPRHRPQPSRPRSALPRAAAPARPRSSAHSASEDTRRRTAAPPVVAREIAVDHRYNERKAQPHVPRGLAPPPELRPPRRTLGEGSFTDNRRDQPESAIRPKANKDALR